MHDSTERAKAIKDEWGTFHSLLGKSQGRKFPWRVNRSPYKILISEILLKRATSTAALRVYTDFFIGILIF
ncbi:MAG: hypothetical protein PWQ74_571 [Methanobacteriaceae archaeon]|jgi:A/G-specific DNA glycosylase|nr:hypothetical protein [Methanobacteriaceae archaeon]